MQRIVEGSCEKGSEPSNFIKVTNCVTDLRNYRTFVRLPMLQPENEAGVSCPHSVLKFCNLKQKNTAGLL
jgi:hypothetical protein